MHLADYKRYPFRYRLTLNWSRPAAGKAGYDVKIKVPSIWRTNWGFGLRVGFRYAFGRYYGRGNDSAFAKEFIDPDHPEFKDRYYYHYILERPYLTFNLWRRIRYPFSVALGVGAQRSKIRQRGAASLLFDEVAQVGEINSWGFLSLLLLWDTRDDIIVPRRGVLHEWSYETSHNALVDVFSEPLDFQRYTLTDTRYYSLSSRLNLANRFVFEVLRGSEKPLDTLGEIGSSRRRMKGLGGIASLRGFDTQRFVDDVRLLSNTEMRYHINSMRWFKQYLEWHGIVFMDLGRVWPDLESLSVRDIHLTGGVGTRLSWDADFVIRVEAGFSSERSFFGLQLRNIF